MYSGPVSLLPGASASLSGKATFFRLSFPWYARRIDFSQIRLSVAGCTGLGLCLQALGSGLLWGSPSRLSGLFALGTALVPLSRAPSELSSSVTLQLYWVGGPPLSGLRSPSASVGVESATHLISSRSTSLGGWFCRYQHAQSSLWTVRPSCPSSHSPPSCTGGLRGRPRLECRQPCCARDDTPMLHAMGYLVEPARRAG